MYDILWPDHAHFKPELKLNFLNVINVKTLGIVFAIVDIWYLCYKNYFLSSYTIKFESKNYNKGCGTKKTVRDRRNIFNVARNI